MRKSRYIEEQIVGMLKESEAGLETAELYREHRISEQSLHRSKAAYGGPEVSDAQRLRQLEEENPQAETIGRRTSPGHRRLHGGASFFACDDHQGVDLLNGAINGWAIATADGPQTDRRRNPVREDPPQFGYQENTFPLGTRAGAEGAHGSSSVASALNFRTGSSGSRMDLKNNEHVPASNLNALDRIRSFVESSGTELIHCVSAICDNSSDPTSPFAIEKRGRLAVARWASLNGLHFLLGPAMEPYRQSHIYPSTCEIMLKTFNRLGQCHN
jgi:putative transposase